MLLKDFFEDVYRPSRLRGKSSNTSRLYRLSISSFAKTVGHPPTLADLTNENVSAHMQRLLDLGRAKATANKDRSQLLAIWRYATQREYLNTWPDVQAEVEPARVPQAWLADDVRKLFAAVDDLSGKIGTIDRWLWWRCLLMLCLDTGERIGAIRQAKWAWLERSWLTVPAEARKGSKRDRQYLLGLGTLERLERLRAQNQAASMQPA